MGSILCCVKTEEDIKMERIHRDKNLERIIRL